MEEKTDIRKLAWIVQGFDELFDDETNLFQRNHLCNFAISATYFFINSVENEEEMAKLHIREANELKDMSNYYKKAMNKYVKQLERNRIMAIVDNLGAGEKITLDEIIEKLNGETL
jgi:hypothetical protein